MTTAYESIREILKHRQTAKVKKGLITCFEEILSGKTLKIFFCQKRVVCQKKILMESSCPDRSHFCSHIINVRRFER